MYIGGDENSQRWIKDFKQQLVAVPEKLESIDGRLCDYVSSVCVMMTLFLLHSNTVLGADDP